MLHADREALLCDFAEYYHVYDLRALPILTVAALAVGLRADSRIKLKMSGLKNIPSVVLYTAIADKLALIHYYLTADKATPKPVLFQDVLFGNVKEKTEKGYATIEEYEKARAEILEGVTNG